MPDSRITELSSLPTLYDFFQTKFKDEPWKDWEAETLAGELGLEGVNLEPLLVDKVWVLKAIASSENPNQLISDPVFFVHACDVINGNPADFESFPSPTSLEVGAAVVSLRTLFSKMGVQFQPTQGLKEVAARSLVDDGFSTAPTPLEFAAGVSGLSLFGPTSKEDLTKAQALHAYVKYLGFI